MGKTERLGSFGIMARGVPEPPPRPHPSPAPIPGLTAVDVPLGKGVLVMVPVETATVELQVFVAAVVGMAAPGGRGQEVSREHSCVCPEPAQVSGSPGPSGEPEWPPWKGQGCRVPVFLTVMLLTLTTRFLVPGTCSLPAFPLSRPYHPLTGVRISAQAHRGGN